MKDKRKLHKLSSTYDVISMRRKRNFKLTSPIIFYTKETETERFIPLNVFVLCEFRRTEKKSHENMNAEKGKREDASEIVLVDN